MRTGRLGTGAIALALTAAALAGAGSASAVPAAVHPAGSTCSGDVCMYLSAPSGGKLYVQGSAYTTSFRGYLRLTGPAGVPTTDSPVATWQAGGVNYYEFDNVPALSGYYCVAGYVSPGNAYEGAACRTN